MFDMNKTFASVEAKFKTYKQLLVGVAERRIRHLFVQGSPGLGKSWEAERVFSAKRGLKYGRSAGHTTPLSLYQALYERRAPNNVLLLDDCDVAFKNEQSMNLLKAATDTREHREVAWHSTSRLVTAQQFEFHGALVVITNEDLTRPRYAPLLDRVHYYNLEMTVEEKVARIITIMAANPKPATDVVVTWLIANHARLGERLTIRTALKALELATLNADSWEELAEATIV